MRSLRARVTFATIAVAVLAVLVTGVISLQLTRSATTDEARRQLAAQADILAKVPRLVSVAELEDKASLALGGTLVALVQSDGSVDGDASEYVDPLILRRVTNGESVSTARRDGLGLVMIEARPARDGTAIVLALPVSSVERAVGQSSWRIALALVIGLAVAIVGGAILSRVLSRPLVGTAAAAKRLAAGERSVPMPESSTTELAAVTSALSALDKALVSSESRQKEFLLSISHELRTPLTALRGYGEAMVDSLIAPSELSTIGATLVAETERLDRFVSDLLELARLDAEDFTIVHNTFAVRDLLDETAAAWAGRAQVVGLSVTVSGASGMLSTDRGRLRQVIDGLVENGLRAGGAVVLAEADGVIEVCDDGPGLNDDDLAVAFDRGVVRARYRDVRPVGTGLGLSIAARLTSRLGGSLTARSPADGGTVFAVRIDTATVTVTPKLG